MSQRISHSLLDPYLGPSLKAIYPKLNLPRSFPPEGIVLLGHLSAIAGAIGFAYCTRYWWGGILAAAGVLGNHVADCVDGTHARATGQCRNGGELLDHFTDPLSFSYWLVGIGVACGRLDVSLVAVICLFSIAVLTNIKAKLIGEFTLQRFGPTELKAVLFLMGLSTASLEGFALFNVPTVQLLLYAYVTLVVAGIISLVAQLVSAVDEVNRRGDLPDSSEWDVR